MEEDATTDDVATNNPTEFFDLFLGFRGSSLDWLVSKRFVNDRKKLMASFRKFKNTDASNYGMLIMCLLCGAYEIVRVGSMVFILRGKEPFVSSESFVAAFVLFICAFCCAVVVISQHLSKSSRLHNTGTGILKCFHRYAAFVDDSVACLRLSQIAISGLPVLGSIYNGLFMLGRALYGPCTADVSLFEVQICNPEAVINRLPQGILIITALHVLIAQVYFKGADFSAIVASWVVVIIFMNYSLSLVNSDHYLTWQLNAMLIMFMGVSYELERQNMIAFIAANLRVLQKEELSKKNEQLESNRSMVRHIVHEIRGPLNIITIGASVLSQEMQALGMDMKMREIVTDVVDGIKEASGSAGKFVNNLLTFEKLAAGLMKLENTAVNVVNFITTAMKPYVISALDKKIELKFISRNLDDDDVIFADPVKLEQVLGNFLSNAFKVRSVTLLPHLFLDCVPTAYRCISCSIM
jgi:signal transduction histidine kinase